MQRWPWLRASAVKQIPGNNPCVRACRTMGRRHAPGWRCAACDNEVRDLDAQNMIKGPRRLSSRVPWLMAIVAVFAAAPVMGQPPGSPDQTRESEKKKAEQAGTSNNRL